jgi:hypothetical protein
MRATAVLVGLSVAALAMAAGAADPIRFDSPGFPPSALDAQGRLLEDWGPLGITLQGEGVTAGAVQVAPCRLDEVIPAARAVASRGAVRLTTTAFRAPVFPSGVDVYCVDVEEIAGRAANVSLALDLPDKATFGRRTVTLANRIVVTLPAEANQDRELRDWGYCDDAAALPNWARPDGKCDPAFRNIRAGMGGVPIVYRESHWATPRQRPLVCQVEGAARQAVDPVARWGQHKPGALVFKARDENRDGKLELAVLPAPGAEDRNPILNAIWLFPPGESINVNKVIAGDLNAAAMRYVDVGGPGDQSIYAPGKIEYRLALPAGGKKTLTFMAACAGGTSPVPATVEWTPESLRRAAREVWRDWKP